MPFDWKEYRVLADRLRVQQDDASKRSAISRAYYSIFHLAKEHLIKFEGFHYSEGSDVHRRVWDGFLGKDITHTAIRTKGIRLRDFRKYADYESEIEKLDDVMMTAFQNADHILDYLDQIERKKTPVEG